MNPERTKALRYGARWLGINLALLMGAFGGAGFTLDSLTHQAFLIVVCLANAGWVYHVVSGYADTGTLPDVPPASERPVPVVVVPPLPPAPPVGVG